MESQHNILALDTPQGESMEPFLGTEQAHFAKLMIVDDEPINVKAVRRHLVGHGYRNFVMCSEANTAMSLIRQEMPDLLLLDILMPEVSGLDILRQMNGDPQLATIPVLVLTASSERSVKLQALEMGAHDFLSKPVDPNELATRVRNALTTKAHYDHLASYSEQLEREVESRTAELAWSRLHLIHCLARAAEFRDSDTGMHIIRVGRYAALIAAKLGMRRKFCELIEQAALLHDVGKIAIPDSILHKPGKLTASEYDLMKRHCVYGAKIIQPISSAQWGMVSSQTALVRHQQSPVISMAARIALSHHEKWDGSGYPRQLRGEEIPMEGRITAVADVFDALSSERPYKKRYSLERCLQMLEDDRDKHFDPRVLDAFLGCLDDVRKVMSECSDPSLHASPPGAGPSSPSS